MDNLRYICDINYMKRSLVYILLLISMCTWAQSTDEKLAAQFYENGEFDKAEDLYKNLYKNNENSLYIYENYLNTLIALDDEKGAEKLVEKQIKRHPNGINHQVDLGYVYIRFDKKEEANKYFEKLTKKHINDPNAINMLAQSMQRRQMGERAIEVYEEGTKKHGPISFYSQLMYSYRATKKLTKLTDLALLVLVENPSQYKYVLKYLDAVYEDEEAVAYLQENTLLHAQKHTDSPVFDELLLEIYVQQKKFKAALRQVIALDKRNDQKGARVMQMAETFVNNKHYDEAVSGYQYVSDLGESTGKYLIANEGLINALYLKNTSSLVTDPAEINALKTRINALVEKYGVNHRTAQSLFRLAELYIFYDKNVGAGVTILEDILETPRLQASFKANSKLLLGDAYLMQDNIWDAKLMYGQVDKQFKEDALGQEAKFRNAKLSYYTGDFEWAVGQLDILKTATTQLISNNAIELALLIQDNTGLDSTEDAMKEYAKAEFYLFQNNIQKCTEILNMLPFKYPDHTLNDEIYFLKARVQEKLGNYEAANKLYTTIYEKYGEDILADNALFKSATITLQVLKDREKAQSLFEKLILQYNSSLFAVDARKIYYSLKDGMSTEDMFINGIMN